MAKKNDHFFIFLKIFFCENDVLEIFAMFSTTRPDCDLAVLLRRWWILRNNSTLAAFTNTSKG